MSCQIDQKYELFYRKTVHKNCVFSYKISSFSHNQGLTLKVFFFLVKIPNIG